jgi:hypothetical protein
MSTSGGNFDPTLDFNASGQLVVKGPFAADPKDLIGTGLIRFLLIKKEGSSDSPTSSDPRITQYYGFYNPADDLNNWVGNVPAADIKSLANLSVTPTAGAPTTDVDARGIAAAVLVMKDQFGSDIPAVHTVTWCQDVIVRYPNT